MYGTKNPIKKNTLRPVFTVSELTGQVKDLLETTFEFVYVAGEISNAKLYPSGHWYFSIKDKEATLPCVCFKNASRNVRFKLEDGLSVIVHGKLSVYPPRGAYQMIVTALEPVGIGEWQLAFEQLKGELEREGLLKPERKRPIPMLPKKVGVVTSPVGAAVRDILHTIRRRNKLVDIIISPAKVQGEGSPESIVDALRLLSVIPDLDVIIVARGGGSIEDLWSFNTEPVARAIAECKVPTISGVGHETDVTICDLVADLRAPTPTAAAELVARGYTEITEQLSNLKQKLSFQMGVKLDSASRRLEQLSPERSLARYQERLQNHLLKVTHFKQRLEAHVDQQILKRYHRWSQANEKLKVLGLQNVLSRGYSILRKADGSLVTDANQVQVGDQLEALLASGKLVLEVKYTEDSW